MTHPSLKSINARFWVHINGSMVKITLKPKQVMRWYQAEPDDEGFHYEAEEISFDGFTLWRESSSGGRDCDGPIDRYVDSHCTLFDIANDPERTPCWDHDSNRVRDAICHSYGVLSHGTAPSQSQPHEFRAPVASCVRQHPDPSYRAHGRGFIQQIPTR